MCNGAIDDQKGPLPIGMALRDGLGQDDQNCRGTSDMECSRICLSRIKKPSSFDGAEVDTPIESSFLFL